MIYIFIHFYVILYIFIYFYITSSSITYIQFTCRRQQPKLYFISNQKFKMEAMIAGALAGAVSNAILYPWERIKIQMQVTHEDQTHHVSLKHAIKTIKKTQGLQGFYKGLKPLVVGNALSNGIYFFVYQKIKLLFPNQTMLNLIYSSAIAGSITTVFVNPFWMLQTRMALSKEDKTFFTTLKEIVEKQGLSSIWKGLSSSLILVSNPIIQFCLYQWLKKLLLKGNSKSDLIVFLVAAFSKAIATIFTYPYTIIRTFQHLKPPDKTMFQITKQMIQKEGFSCLFKGLTPKLIQTVLNAALIMTIYQRIKIIIMKILLKMGRVVG